MRTFILLLLAVVIATAADSVPAKLPTLLDLGSKKCIPCKKMEPILEALSKDFAGRLTVTFIDVNNGETGLKAFKDWEIQLIPTQIFIDAKGKERFRHEGFYSREEILAQWKELGVDLGAPAVATPAAAATGTGK